ncbi:MAG: class B sortase [Tyzzerella sp.]|nr:class B sortase [Tyzzerella sp.]
MSETVKRKHHRGRRKKRGKSNVVSNIILVIAIAVFLFSGYKLISIFSEYNKGETEYEDLQDVVISYQPKEETTDSEASEEELVFEVDFEKLLSINSEAVAWIRFDNPSQISYPVVKASDNDKYLKTTFEGKKNSAGALFMDYQNAGDFTDENTFIYGHNMKNGSMFGRLRNYKNSSFCKENPYFYIYLPDGREVQYQVFAACVVKDTSETYDKFYNNAEEFQNYIKYVRGCALYSTDVEVTAESQIVSLSTCTNVSDDERLVIHGVKVSEQKPEEQ